MRKIKKGLTVFILLLLTTVFCISFAACGNDNTSDSRNGKSAAEIEESAPYGLYTDLQFIFKGENGYVSASVKNKFTLFPSTVTVNIELYRSDASEESVANMTLVASNYIYDLDQGETLTATASTEGRQSYWKARATYRIDNKAWKENLSETVFFNADGIKTTTPEPLPDDKEYFISDFLQSDALIIQATIPESYIVEGEAFNIYNYIANVHVLDKDDLSCVKNMLVDETLELFISNSDEKKLNLYYLVGIGFHPQYSLVLSYNNEKTVIIKVNDKFQTELNANIFVTEIDNGEEKIFKGLLADEIKEKLLETAKNMYNSKKGE